MNKLSASLLVAGGIGFMAGSDALGIANLGFETGNFTGWSVNGTADVATGHIAVDDPRVYAPQEGLYFARLVAGLGINVYSTLSQTFSMTAGESISGSVAFDAADELPYNDNAYLRIQSSSGTVTLWTASVASVGDFGSTPWQAWGFVAPTSDTYTITLAVANGGIDNDFPSLALLDLGGIAQLPDNGAMLSLLGISLIGLLSLRNKSFALR